jgi:putative hydrolase of the HAD superfamily
MRPPQRHLRDIETWIFDLDNTLYSASLDLFGQIDIRMRDYIADFLGLSPEEAYRVQKHYFRQYGTSLRGLMRQHGMDPRPFLDHVHDIDVSVLPPAPALDAALGALPGRKVIYTNASTRHAERVMARLGVGHHFDAVYDIIEADYEPKPEPRPYADLVRRFGLNPRSAAMVEDVARNLTPAAALGMTTVWVRNDTDHGVAEIDGVPIDHIVDDLVSWLEQVVATA